MKTLQEILTDPARRPAVVADCLEVIDAEVESKRGLTGIAIKGAYAIVKAVKPGFVRAAMDDLLEDFAARLDPMFQAARQASTPLPDHFTPRAGEAADALLGITDDRSRRAKNQTVKKAYDKLRPTAKRHVEEAIPRVSQMLERQTRGIE